MDGRRSRVLGAVLAIAVLAVGCGRSTEPAESAPVDSISIGALGSESSSNAPDLAVDVAAACGVDDVATVSIEELPDEALDTLQLIEDGGPYPFRQDDGVFQNRERLLPKHDRGYYREYTVITPSEDDRGARRIITGDCGERFYTDDHYDSFRLIED
jgi:ribonuclease T1